ncbi:double zinc ribbon domain-containing protein [Natrinema salaciae]|uniref:DZANK-type domain-containing protein n=1 Tax=Natrinema salaciae TaxID=1186196 RepID=A0A1H9LBA2_9EURY|nr:zinc ribbon domain-containing protein [Natrinema salaciae]SER08650.1 hypothetical protein SAMN04489841_2908 [Natrinema salaciae]
MSKITFRADDDLVEQLEGLEISKSEAMREALRSYLESGAARDDDAGSEPVREADGAIDDLVRERVDERLETRLRELGLEHASSRTRESNSSPPAEPQDVSISISLEGATESDDRVRVDGARTRQTTVNDDGRPNRSQQRTETRPEETDTQCNQCGDRLDGDHVYCPNCGEKASKRLFCDCGDEIRSDWSFCPSCGRRTPAADVLESDGQQY